MRLGPEARRAHRLVVDVVQRKEERDSTWRAVSGPSVIAVRGLRGRAGLAYHRRELLQLGV